MAMTSAPGRWEHFHHVADIGVRGLGSTMAEAFSQTALAMTAVITDLGTVRPARYIPIRCQAQDPELLLVDWLNTLIYEMAVRHMLFSRFQVTIVDLVLNARAWGEEVDRPRHQPAVEVKGATYTALTVAQNPDGLWLAQCVVDV